jgi:hypothetical protein
MIRKVRACGIVLVVELADGIELLSQTNNLVCVSAYIWDKRC